jgi:hypothetical protein
MIVKDNPKAHTKNIVAPSAFKINASAKAFQILSDGLYSDKISAPIRELSSNAYDSHVADGKPDLPFEVHLPTVLEPYFSVRDFGVGLCEEDVFNVFTTYFESFKTDTNELVGCLGLGSKSPFAYTDIYTTTAWFNGVKTLYSMFLDNGFPQVAKIHEEPTTEHNGLCVSFSVKQGDYNLFSIKAANIYGWYKVKPNITGNIVEIPDYLKYSKCGNGWFTLDDKRSLYSRNIRILTGNTIYEVSSSECEVVESVCNMSLVLFCDIGEIDITPSREKVALTALTQSTIQAKVNNVMAEYALSIQEKINKCPSLFDAFYLYQGIMCQHRQIKWVSNFDFKYKQKSLLLYVPSFADRYMWQCKYSSACFSTGVRYQQLCRVEYLSLHTADNHVFILNDIKTGGKKQSGIYACKNPESVVYLIPSHPKLSDRQICKSLGILPSRLKRASVIFPPAPSRKKNVAINYDEKIEYVNQYILKMLRKAWAFSVIPKGQDKYYYVDLLAYDATYNTRRALSLSEIACLVDFLNIEYDTQIPEVYGVRRNARKAVRENPRWINLFDYAKEKIALYITPQHIELYKNHITWNKLEWSTQTLAQQLSLVDSEVLGADFRDLLLIFKDGKCVLPAYLSFIFDHRHILLDETKKVIIDDLIGGVMDKSRDISRFVRDRHPVLKHLIDHRGGLDETEAYLRLYQKAQWWDSAHEQNLVFSQ